jgi:tetratricopeptide (TPR) repeat protein
MRHHAAALAVCLIASVAPLGTSALPSNAVAFRDAPLGTVIKNRTMPTIDGRKEQLLSSAKANVFVFFRTGQDHSVEALRQFAKLEAEMKGRPVRFVGIVSSSEPPADVLAIARETGIRWPILVDEADALYGELGVYLHPSIGIADDRGKLKGYQPFRKINLLDATRGRIQLALGEIDDAQMAAILDPPPAPIATKSRAHARVTLARALLGAGKIDDAIASLRRALEVDPNYADAHATLAEALARSGLCAEAETERDAAHRLAPAAPPAPPVACARR